MWEVERVLRTVAFRLHWRSGLLGCGSGNPEGGGTVHPLLRFIKIVGIHTLDFVGCFWRDSHTVVDHVVG
jgi:hypothetical protein